jgi:hypothetical protein
MPRHPPCALNNLATKMLASTVQFSKYGRTRHHRSPRTHPHNPHKPRGSRREPFGGTTDHHHYFLPKGQPATAGACSLRTQQCAAPPAIRPAGKLLAFHPHEQPIPRHPPGTQALRTHPPHRAGQARRMLLRKEVIQPHLPVRLPCYDFVPIASPTFDGSPPKGLGHRLRVLPTFVT